jgi:hypothetical protein
MTNASMGHQARLGIKREATYGSAVAVDTQLVFVQESLAKRGTLVERHGLRGTRSHQADDTRGGTYTVSGTLLLEPTPEDLAVILPLILGGSPSGNSYPLAETVPSFTCSIDRVAKVFTYAGCKVTKAIFSGAAGGLLRLALEIVGQSETVAAAGTFPSLTATITPPYIFSDLVLTLQSAAREVSQFELVIDNALVADRFMNATTIASAPEGDRTVMLSTTHPFAAANADLYGQALAGTAGTLALSNGGYSTVIQFGTLQVPDHSPVVASRAEIPLRLQMTARKSGAAAELSVTHDSTP